MSVPPLLEGLQAVPALMAGLLAAATAAVARALAGRARSPHRALALAWCLGGSVTVGTGLWVTWWVAAGAAGLGGAAVPGLLAAALGWSAAVGSAALAVGAASRLPPGWAGQGIGAAILLAGMAAVHGLGLALQGWSPDESWHTAVAGGATLLLLAPVYFAARVDERMQQHAHALSRSLREANADLQRAVEYDALTGLPSRRLLLERLDLATCAGPAPGPQAAVLALDLDGFKTLNDLFGHDFGDGVLCEVANRLAALAQPQDTVARLAGDEFIVLMAGVGSAAAAEHRAQLALASLQAPLRVPGGEARLSASLGIAMFPAHGTPDKLLAAADTAMHEAKRLGGGRVLFFATRMEDEARGQLELQRDLRDALDHPERGELSLHYQPKVSARDGRITGVEALLRWRHPVRGPVGPAEFIPVAERFGLIDRLGAWVIDEACAQMQAWQQQGLRMRVAVNLSMHQVRQPGLVERVRRALTRHGLTPARLMFEITESAAMDDKDGSGSAFDGLASLGTELAIDDFGTGYSSLAYLRRLPSRQIKIDRSFVMDMDSCSDALAIVEAVIRLAHALGLAVVAEGVETPAQRDLLLQLQCDEFQGYLYARPVGGDTLLAWARGQDRPALLDFEASWLPASPAGQLVHAAPA